MEYYDTARCVDRRPEPSKRSFASLHVETFLDDLSSKMTGDRDLACLFANVFPNTLDTTVRQTLNDSFVITGDIDAMWLRDSVNQLLPYVPLAAADVNISNLLAGVLRTQTRQVLADPYANAHYDIGNGGPSPNAHDDTSSPSAQCAAAARGNGTLPDPSDRRRQGMVAGIYERKYELDSLLAFLKLGRVIYGAVSSRDAAGDLTVDPFAPFDAVWLSAVGAVLDVLEAQSTSSATDAGQPCGPAYTFSRSNIDGQGPLSSLVNGVGPPAAHTGMVRSAFRPSDDACTFAYHIPSNAMAVVELNHTARMLRALPDGSLPAPLAVWLAARCEAIAASITRGIAQFGVVDRPDLGGSVYAYEADGYGNHVLMDDANVPSLLSLPWLGFVDADEPTYVRTRAYVLSPQHNPWFFAGEAGDGVGGPHIGPSTIWPMAVIMRALTSTSDVEIADALATIKRSADVADAGAWLMHESFEAADATAYTRPWFAWCNSLLGSLIVKLSQERPHLVGIP